MGLNYAVVFVVFFLCAQCQVASGQWFRQLVDALGKREHFVVKSPPKIQPDVKLDPRNHDVMLPMGLPHEDVHFDLSDPLSRPLRIEKSDGFHPMFGLGPLLQMPWMRFPFNPANTKGDGTDQGTRTTQVRGRDGGLQVVNSQMHRPKFRMIQVFRFSGPRTRARVVVSDIRKPGQKYQQAKSQQASRGQKGQISNEDLELPSENAAPAQHTDSSGSTMETSPVFGERDLKQKKLLRLSTYFNSPSIHEEVGLPRESESSDEDIQERPLPKPESYREEVQNSKYENNQIKTPLMANSFKDDDDALDERESRRKPEGKGSDISAPLSNADKSSKHVVRYSVNGDDDLQGNKDSKNLAFSDLSYSNENNDGQEIATENKQGELSVYRSDDENPDLVDFPKFNESDLHREHRDSQDGQELTDAVLNPKEFSDFQDRKLEKVKSEEPTDESVHRTVAHTGTNRPTGPDRVVSITQATGREQGLLRDQRAKRRANLIQYKKKRSIELNKKQSALESEMLSLKKEISKDLPPLIPDLQKDKNNKDRRGRNQLDNDFKHERKNHQRTNVEEHHHEAGKEKHPLQDDIDTDLHDDIETEGHEILSDGKEHHAELVEGEHEDDEDADGEHGSDVDKEELDTTNAKPKTAGGSTTSKHHQNLAPAKIFVFVVVFACLVGLLIFLATKTSESNTVTKSSSNTALYPKEDKNKHVYYNMTM